MLTLSATEFTFSERKLNDFHFVNQLGFSRRERPPHMRFLAIKSILAAVVVTTGSLPAHVAKANTTSTCCGLCSSARTTSHLDNGPAPDDAARLSQGR